MCSLVTLNLCSSRLYPDARSSSIPLLSVLMLQTLLQHSWDLNTLSLQSGRREISHLLYGFEQSSYSLSVCCSCDSWICCLDPDSVLSLKLRSHRPLWGAFKRPRPMKRYMCVRLACSKLQRMLKLNQVYPSGTRLCGDFFLVCFFISKMFFRTIHRKQQRKILYMN